MFRLLILIISLGTFVSTIILIFNLFRNRYENPKQSNLYHFFGLNKKHNRIFKDLENDRFSYKKSSELNIVELLEQIKMNIEFIGKDKPQVKELKDLVFELMNDYSTTNIMSDKTLRDNFMAIMFEILFKLQKLAKEQEIKKNEYRKDVLGA
jgi:hypothetical protein